MLACEIVIAGVPTPPARLHFHRIIDFVSAKSEIDCWEWARFDVGKSLTSNRSVLRFNSLRQGKPMLIGEAV